MYGQCCNQWHVLQTSDMVDVVELLSCRDNASITALKESYRKGGKRHYVQTAKTSHFLSKNIFIVLFIIVAFSRSIF